MGQLEARAAERVKSIINLISQGEFGKLSSVTLIESSWCGGGTQEDGIKAFEEWLKELFEAWEEDFDQKYVVDLYDENRLDLGEFVNGRYFAVYNPTSYGEELDFWFEIKLYLNDNNELISEFNVNI